MRVAVRVSEREGERVIVSERKVKCERVSENKSD